MKEDIGALVPFPVTREATSLYLILSAISLFENDQGFTKSSQGVIIYKCSSTAPIVCMP